MNDKPQEQDLEQVHNDPTPAEQPAEEFSLEDIINEFGGWSKRPPEEPPEPPEEQPEPEAQTPEQPPKPDLGDTVRFTPIREEDAAEQPQVWSYKGEPIPGQEAEDAALAAKKERQEEAEQKRRERRLHRAMQRQKLLESRRSGREERPEHTFASAQEAYQAYSRRDTGRLRLLISLFCTCLSAGLLVIAGTGITGMDMTQYFALFTVFMLALTAVQVLLAYDVYVRGILNLLHFCWDHTGLLVVITAIVLIDGIFALFAQRLSFCTLLSAQILLAQWGETQKLRARFRTLKTVCSMEEATAVVREEKAWHGRDCIFRTQADADAFAVQLELPDAAGRVMRVYAPIITALALLAAGFSAFRSGQNFLQIWAALLLASYPVGALICFALPFSRFAARLAKEGAAVAGWNGAGNLSGECGLIVTDADLFPQKNVTVNGMKIFVDRPAGQIIGYAAAVVETAGSGLVPLFREMQQSQNARHYSVDSFRRYEGGGLGAEMQGDVVLMGSLAFMKLMRVYIPEGTAVRQAVYLSINGDLAAVFALNYAPASAVKNGLHAAVRDRGLTPILATRDFMITPQFLSQRYKLPSERIEFPTVEERARLSSEEALREPKQGVLLGRSSFAGYVSAVISARALRRSTIGSLVISVAGSIIGLLMVAFLAIIGAVGTASAWNLLLYHCLWILPQLLIPLILGRS